MPDYVSNFLAPSRAEIDREKYGNALMRNQVARLPQANRMQDLSIQGAEQDLRAQDQQIGDQQRKNAIGIASNMAMAVAQSQNPVEDARRLFSDPGFVKAVQFLGYPAPTFDPVKDSDPNAVRQNATTFARTLGAQVPQQLKTFEREGALLQQDPMTGKIDQVMPRPAQAALPTDPATVESVAQMIANGQMPMLTGYTLKTPFGQQVVARVSQLNPDYQAGEYPAKASTMRAFASGVEGRTVRSLNVAIAHLGTLSELAGALGNGNVQALNAARNSWQTQTGGAAPTNFTSARDIVANEVVKAVTASGGTLADREEAQRQIQAAASPDQLAGVIKTWKQLLGGQLGGLQQQYEQGSGQKDFQRFLSPKTVRELEGGQGGGGWTVVEVK